MDDTKNMTDYEIAVERRLERACERDVWIASAHVAFGGGYVDCPLEKSGRAVVRGESVALKPLEDVEMLHCTYCILKG